VELTDHGITRIDPFFWMNQRDDPEVLAYLEAENAYAEAMLAPVSGLAEEIFDEILGRIKQDDSSAPYFENGYYYYTRFEEGREYPIFARRAGSMEAPEEVLLDVNELAEGYAYYRVASTVVSDDGRLLAFAAYNGGRRVYTLYIKDLESGEILPYAIAPTTGNAVWAADNETLFFERQDTQTLRSYQILRYRLGTDPGTAELVFQEDDETFRAGVGRTKSGEFLTIGSFQTVSTEWRILDETIRKDWEHLRTVSLGGVARPLVDAPHGLGVRPL
jgi:oligopeptidase B